MNREREGMQSFRVENEDDILMNAIKGGEENDYKNLFKRKEESSTNTSGICNQYRIICFHGLQNAKFNHKFTSSIRFFFRFFTHEKKKFAEE